MTFSQPSPAFPLFLFLTLGNIHFSLQFLFHFLEANKTRMSCGAITDAAPIKRFSSSVPEFVLELSKSEKVNPEADSLHKVGVFDAHLIDGDIREALLVSVGTCPCGGEL